MGEETKDRQQIQREEGEQVGSLRAPEEREHTETEHDRREQGLDKTLEDSFPSSDPPSSIPDPDEEEDAA